MIDIDEAKVGDRMIWWNGVDRSDGLARAGVVVLQEIIIPHVGGGISPSARVVWVDGRDYADVVLVKHLFPLPPAGREDLEVWLDA